MKELIETFFVLCYIIFERINTMNKNYYDILQINRNASPEIIEKAYKTLAKKYHPDLQTEENKKQAEEILKEINEAYEILSEPEKKQIYDASLDSQEPKQSEKNSNPNNNQTQTHSDASFNEELYNKEQQIQQERLYQEQLRREQELIYQQQLEQARQQAYHDAYIQDLKNRGYKIRYKKSLKDYITSAISVAITLLILFLLWHIPFVKNFFVSMYLENEVIHALVDMIANFFTKRGI